MSEPRSGVVYIRGEIVAADEARISVFDHSVLYGDGIFETFRIVDGQIFRMTDHLQRLVRSAAGLQLALPMPVDDIAAALRQTIVRSGLANCFTKLLVTRGSGNAPVLNHQGLASELIIVASPAMPLVATRSAGPAISAATVSTRKTSPAALDPRIKSLNYLNIIQSRIEANGLGADESILLDDQGRVVEASVYNIIVAHGGCLTTPASGCLEGITLDTVIAAAESTGTAVQRRDIYPNDLAVADEIILTSTAVGVIPVTELNGNPVGAGSPGPKWKALADAYELSLRDRSYLTSVDISAITA